MRNIPCKILLVLMLAATQEMAWAEMPDAVLPAGVKAVWNLDKAQREKTATRERVCLNGLWRWQPARRRPTAVPGADGAISRFPPSGRDTPATPGGLPDALRPSELEECEPGGSHRRLVSARITVPEDWTGRRIALTRGVCELLRRRLRGRQEGGRDPLPWRRSGPHRGMPAREKPTCLVSTSSPCRSRPSCFPTSTPTRPRK